MACIALSSSLLSPSFLHSFEDSVPKPSHRPSNGWWDNFLLKHDEVKLKIAKKIDRLHAFAANPTEMVEFFEILAEIFTYLSARFLLHSPSLIDSHVLNLFRAYPILQKYPQLIWNMDETSTNQNQRLVRAFGGKGQAQPLKLDANSVPNLSMVPFISPGYPHSMPPVFLAPGKLFTKTPHWAPAELEAQDPWRYCAGFLKTESGFMTQAAFGKVPFPPFNILHFSSL